MESSIITRFAPSPTGHLHIGGLRTALYNYLYARANKGKFLLRIEDTDTKRNSQDALQGILEAFKWSGLDYDSPTLFQSQRTQIYQEYAQKLLDSNHAYYCYLSKDELEKIRENRAANHATLTRKYRDFKGEPPKDIKPSVRIKAPLSGQISFSDGIKGEISFASSEIDDFVILRSDGTPTYNFVVAIDDALSGITDLMRGDDHISNTPKQIVVYHALGFKIPRFYHIPMICNEKGQKLSKRDGALSVLEYRAAGILPTALLNFLFRLGFSYGDKEIFSMDEMLSCFNPHEINSKASACNFSKLYWLNSEYIKALSDEELRSMLGLGSLDSMLSGELKSERISCLFSEIKPRVNNLLDFKKAIGEVILGASVESKSVESAFDASHFGALKSAIYDTTMRDKIFKGEAKALLIESLSEFAKVLESSTLLSPESGKDLIHNFAKSIESKLKEAGLKSSVFMQSLRFALLGQKGGIDLGACLFILGKSEVQSRINHICK